MSQIRYSEDFKKSAVSKMLNRGDRQISWVSEETGVPRPTLYQWKKEFANVEGMKKNTPNHTRPQDKSAKDKVKAVIDYENLPEEKRGEFLRREGLHSELIRQWKEQMENSLTNSKEKKILQTERSEEKRKIKELEREIKRKDKALAETAALLVLKKKQSRFGEQRRTSEF
jgi:transposase